MPKQVSPAEAQVIEVISQVSCVWCSRHDCRRSAQDILPVQVKATGLFPYYDFQINYRTYGDCLFYANPFVQHTVIAPSIALADSDTNVIASYYSDLYGSDYNLVMSVLDCESDFRMVPGDGGRSFGIGQFSKETFARHSKLLGENLDYYSKHDQIKLVAYISI